MARINSTRGGESFETDADGARVRWRCVECNFRIYDDDRPLACPHCGRDDEDLPLGVDLFGVARSAQATDDAVRRPILSIR